jgi:hypothetical protein
LQVTLGGVQILFALNCGIRTSRSRTTGPRVHCRRG